MNKKEQFLQYGYDNRDAIDPTNRDRFFRAAFTMAKGEPCEEEDFDSALSYLYYRFDCCDFVILALIRLYYQYGKTGLMPESLLKRMKDTFLDFDYWLSEKSRFPSFKIMWTENHIITYHCAEYLAAQLFPEEVFRSRGMTGEELKKVAKAQILDWIRIKGRVGFSEWDSNTYVSINLETLMTLYDFAEDPELTAQAEKLLNIIFLSLALNNHKGIYGCTHGRAYSNAIRDESGNPLHCLLSILWDVDDLRPTRCHNLVSFCYATGSFQPDPMVTQIYRELAQAERFVSFEQESFNVEDAHLFGKGYEEEEDLTLFWQNMGYTHRLVVDNMLKMGEKYQFDVHSNCFPEQLYYTRCAEKGIAPKDCRCTTYMPRVNKALYRTRDYMLSTAQDFRKGEHGFQQHIWQATLAPRAIVFTNHPGEYTEGGRPDLWSGNKVMPRSVQYQNVNISIFRNDEPYTIPYSHAYVPRREFDEVVEVGGWIFVRKGTGYCGLYSQKGYRWSDRPGYDETECICDHRNNIWLCQMGSEGEYGSFAGFVSALLNATPAFEDDQIRYASPFGELVCGWDGDFTCDGKPIALRDYQRFDCGYVHSAYGSGHYVLTCGGQTKTIQF